MSASNPKIRSIEGLYLDLQNPRLGLPPATTEQEALERLMEEFGEKIIALARDIAEYGINYGESWLIVKEDGKDTVLEGNRRLVACRLLEDPEKAPTPGLVSIFERIKGGALVDVSSLKPSCVEYSNRSEANHWIKLKHHGESNGVGTVRWGAEETYLNALATGGGYSEPYEFWYWLRETYKDDSNLVELINKAMRKQYTIMLRIYGIIKKRIGSKFIEPGKIGVDVSPEKIKPFIRAIMLGLVSSSKKSGSTETSDVSGLDSRTLNSEKSREDIIGRIWADTIGEADVSPEPLEHVVSTTPQPNESISESDKKTPSKQVGTENEGNPHVETSGVQQSPATSRVRRPRTRKTDTHLYYGVSYIHMPQRLRDLFKECQKLDIREKPETASVMARVIVELSVDALIKERNIKVSGKGQKELHNKIRAVISYLDPQCDSKKPNLPEIAGIWSAVRIDTVDGHFVRDLNSCVHSYEFTAAYEIAKRAQKLFSPLLNAINDEFGKSRN